ncbi:transposase [Synechococcus sp. BSF8S]|nr:transposase [Synechococcus sp. BSF8S]MBC1265165.1 transposase [Synechococcus sp. BSA11S]
MPQAPGAQRTGATAENSLPSRQQKHPRSNREPLPGSQQADCSRQGQVQVEFGAKITIAVTGDGFTYLDRQNFNPYNEGEDLKAQARAYWRRHGHYPEVICADQIDQTRANCAFCQRHGMRLSGPRLGRPKTDPELVAAEKQQFLADQRQRNAVEGKIGQGKRRFGMGLIRENLAVTQGSAIALSVLVMNLEKLLKLLFVLFAFLLQLLIGNEANGEVEDRLLSNQPAAALRSLRDQPGGCRVRWFLLSGRIQRDRGPGRQVHGGDGDRRSRRY